MEREGPADGTTGGQQPQADGRPGRRIGDLRSVAVGLVAAALVAGLGVVVAIVTPVSYTATASSVVLPVDSTSQQVTASFYEALDQGQIVTTIAQLVQSNIAAGSHPNVQVVAVTNTSIVGVTATASTPEQAAQQANAVAGIGQQIVAKLGIPFSVAMTVPASADLATSNRMAQPTIALLIALVALLVGVGVQQAVWKLRRRRTREEQDRPRTAYPADAAVSPHDRLVASNGHTPPMELDDERPAPSST